MGRLFDGLLDLSSGLEASRQAEERPDDARLDGHLTDSEHVGDFGRAALLTEPQEDFALARWQRSQGRSNLVATLFNEKLRGAVDLRLKELSSKTNHRFRGVLALGVTPASRAALRARIISLTESGS